MKNSAKISSALIFLIAVTASAQQIQTDRPTETEGPNAVAVHQLQVESGFSFEKKEDKKTFEIPEVVLRYGIFKNMELRVEAAMQTDNEADNKVYGIKPAVAGIKYHLLDHKGLLPDMGLLVRVSIPWLADNPYQKPKYSPEVRMLFQHELSKSIHVGYNAGVHWLPDSGAPEYIYTLSADHALFKNFKLVFETYGFTQSRHHAQNSADIAVLLIVNRDLQLDLIAGSGIMHAQSEKFAEIGLSFRI